MNLCAGSAGSCDRRGGRLVAGRDGPGAGGALALHLLPHPRPAPALVPGGRPAKRGGGGQLSLHAERTRRPVRLYLRLSPVSSLPAANSGHCIINIYCRAKRTNDITEKPGQCVCSDIFLVLVRTSSGGVTAQYRAGSGRYKARQLRQGDQSRRSM